MLFFIIIAATVGYTADRMPLKIESNSLKYFSDKKYSVFEGNVKGEYGKNTIYTDKIYVYLDNDDKVDKIICDGNVKMISDNLTATSNRAEYDVNTEMIYLTGNVKVWQKDNYLEGEQITVYNKTKSIEVNKGKDKRVIVIFQPEEGKKDNGTEGNIFKKIIQKKDSSR
jgi:lipopolysaccharide export system protein LptA